MHYLIVGLGNYPDQYLFTRHNAGFIILDEIASCIESRFKIEKKFNSLIADYRTEDGTKYTLLKPLTYMNNSGTAVSTYKNFYKIPLDKIIIIHDEVDFPFGKVKFKCGGGDAGNNGLKSITSCVAANAYMRIRIGIGRPTVQEFALCDYLLSNFTNEQLEIIRKFGKIFGKNILDLFNQNAHAKIYEQLKQK